MNTFLQKERAGEDEEFRTTVVRPAKHFNKLTGKNICWKFFLCSKASIFLRNSQSSLSSSQFLAVSNAPEMLPSQSLSKFNLQIKVFV